jgi:uncharacterized protein (DUF1697 family)
MPRMARTTPSSAGTRRVVALLRAVNVGGRVLRMAELKAMLVDLGFDAPQTLLQSGNVVFGVGGGTRRAALDAIEARLERGLESRLTLQSDVFVRSVAEWNAVIAANPFRQEAESDPSHLVVMLLKHAPTASAVQGVRAAIKGREAVQAHDRQLYIVYPDGIGPSKLTGSVIERALGTRGTARNWNTTLKLAALAASDTH